MIFSTSQPYLLINMFIYKQWPKLRRTHSLNVLMTIVNIMMVSLYRVLETKKVVGMNEWFSDSEWSVPLRGGRFSWSTALHFCLLADQIHWLNEEKKLEKALYSSFGISILKEYMQIRISGFFMKLWKLFVCCYIINTWISLSLLVALCISSALKWLQ